MPGEREQALAQIRGLASEYDLSTEEILRALDGAEIEETERAGLLSRILAILGAIFVFAGVAVFIALNWEGMNSAARIIVTLGSGVAVFVLALMADDDERYEGTAVPLYIVAACLQPLGLLVAIDEFSTGGDWRHAALLVAGVMSAQQGVVFYLRRRSVLLFTSILFGLWFLVQALELLGTDGALIGVVLGGSTVLLCAGLGQTRYVGVTPFWFLLGSIAFYAGLYDLVDGSVLDLAFLAAACGGVVMSVGVRSRVVLAVSTVAILAYIGEFTREHFLESLGWPVVLIVIGIAFILLSGVALKISKRYIRGSE